MIRRIRNSEINILDDFLYEAIFVPEGLAVPPRDIIKQPELQVYTENFGKRNGDICYVADIEGRIVGAAWVRIMNDYGHIEENVPSWAISLYKEYRGKGIGTDLMKAVINELINQGFTKTSLSVQKENPAWHLYQRLGFKIIREDEQEYFMVKAL